MDREASRLGRPDNESGPFILSFLAALGMTEALLRPVLTSRNHTVQGQINAADRPECRSIDLQADLHGPAMARCKYIRPTDASNPFVQGRRGTVLCHGIEVFVN